MSEVHAYAAYDGEKAVRDFTYKPRELDAHDVEIKVTHCGVCASDVHLVDGDWGEMGAQRPLVAGHEVVGTVVRAGPEATVAVGTRVGAGWQSGCCESCKQCTTDNEQYCAGMEQLMQGEHKASGTRSFGGFADRTVVDSRFVYEIPEGLGSAQAAPLLCAGLTVFSPLKRFAGSAGARVGVVGIGGLGHLGLQFAKALGHTVTAISHSASKEEFARQLGATEFVNSSDAEAMKKHERSLDLLLVTISAPIDWDAYLALLDVNGTAALVGVPTEKLQMGAMSLIFASRRVAGSLLSSRAEAREMLQLAADKKIGAMITELPMSEVNVALDRVRQGQPRFRDVLVSPDA